RPPPRSHSRVRHPRGLEYRISFLRRLAELAGGARPGSGPRTRPRGACPGDAAAAGPGPGAWRALVCQGPGPDSRGHAETEERLLAVGRAGTADHVERIVRGWRRVDRIAEAR